MPTYKGFQERVLAGLNANLTRAERLVELHKNMLKSKMLSESERETTTRGLELNEQSVRMYKDLIKESKQRKRK